MAPSNQNLMCKIRTNEFCFCCARYVKVKNRHPITEKLQILYKNVYNVDKLENHDQIFAGSIFCATCVRNLRLMYARKEMPTQKPAKWNNPREDHSNCFLCHTHLSIKQKGSPSRFNYRKDLSCVLPRKMISNERTWRNMSELN